MSAPEAKPPAASTPLAQRILRETARFAALQTVASVLGWSANLLLARLLGPVEFGAYATCTFFVGVGTLLGDGGLGATLLRRKTNPTPEEFRVTLTSLLAVAAVMSVALFAGAPWLGRYYHMTATQTHVLRVMAALYFVGAFRVVPYIRMERELMFARIARIELIASVTRHVVAITLAFALSKGGGIWALAVSNMLGAVLQLTLAYRASPGWVGLGWSWHAFRPLIAYGSKVQALAICAFLKDNISGAMLGVAVGQKAVGIYNFGQTYIQLPVIAVNGLARVQLPVYARLELRDPTLYAALRGATRTAMLLGVPFLCAAALAAPWVVPTMYTPKWLPAYPIMWGLLANMVGGLIASPLFTLLQGQGRAGTAIAVFLGWTAATWTLAVASVLRFPGNLGLIAAAHSVVTVVVVAGLAAWAGRRLGRSLLTPLITPVVAGAVGLAAGLELLRHGPSWARHPLVAAVASLVAYVVAVLLREGRTVIAEVRAVIAGTRSPAGTPAATEPGSGDLDRAA